MNESLDDLENYEVDQPVPETRRNFALEIATLVVSGLLGLVPVAVGLFTFFDPLRRKSEKPLKFRGDASGKEGFTRVASLDAVPVGSSPQRFPVIDDKRDAWNFIPNQPIGAVFVEHADDGLRVFNSTCPHAGCSVACDGNAYHCPCHNSSFNLDGSKRVSDSGRENPSPRSLDSLEVDDAMLKQGEIWVRYENFYTGIEQKISKS